MAVSRFSTVLTSNTNGDTFTGPCRIVGIKTKGGSGSATLTSSAGSVVFYDSGTLASGIASQMDEVDVQIPGGVTVTIGITSTATIWLYLK